MGRMIQVSRRPTVVLAFVAALAVVAALATAQTQRYEFKHSFRAPFYLGRGGTLPFWEFGGSTVVSEDRVRLTPALQSRVGWVWNTVPADMDAWEVQLEYEIGGGGGRGADGMALWYVADPKLEGIAMGSKEEFKGLALFLDTFDNDGQNDNPRLSLWINDGSQRFEPSDDGKHGEKGHCKSIVREARSKIRVVYRDGLVQVETDVRNGWQFCTSVAATLPKGYYFGVSAATGHLMDNHDVFSFVTYNLDPWRQKRPVQPQDAGPEPAPLQSEPEHDTREAAQHVPSPENNFQQHQNIQQQQLSPPPPPPQQQQQQPQQQHYYQQLPPSPQEQTYNQRDTGAQGQQLENLLSKVESMKALHDVLNHAVNRVYDKVSTIQPQDQSDKDLLRNVQETAQHVQAGLNELRQVEQDHYAHLSRAISELKAHVSAEQTNSFNSISRLLRELQQQVNIVQTTVERGDRDQNNALRELKSSKEEIKTAVESSGSIAWWVYFAFFQLCFGVGFVLWKKAHDDAAKKFL